MKTLIIYNSQTGFTKKYAEWIAEGCNGELLPIKQAEKKPDSFFEDFDAISYGGWTMGGNITKLEWFQQKLPSWKGKKLAVFCVGASPAENPDIDSFIEKMENLLPETKVFYCQGGISYEKMKLPMKLMMKIFSTGLRNKKDASEKERAMGEMLSKSYDISDKKYAEPIIEALK